MSVNIGHGAPAVIEAIKKQADTLCYASPYMATEPRARLGKLLAEVAPGTSTSPSSPSAAPRRTRTPSRSPGMVTGRHKIIVRYRSYHGGTAALPAHR